MGLTELGWTDGRNMRMDVLWAVGNVDRARMFAKALVDLQPDVILATTTPVTAAVQRETRTIPIVFAGVTDPVGDPAGRQPRWRYLRLMTNSNSVGCITGRSAGFCPFRIRPT